MDDMGKGKPRAWFGDRMFWRDVMANVVAGLILIVLAVIMGIVSGAMSDETATLAKRSLMALIMQFVFIVAMRKVLLTLVQRSSRLIDDGKASFVYWVLSACITLITMVVFVEITSPLVERLIP